MTGSILGEYKGQWLRGMRHGYGTRQSVPYGVAATFHAKTQLQISSSTPSATDVDEDKRDRINRVDESRGGFVLKSRSDDAPATTGGRRSFLDKHSKGTIGKILRLSLRKQHSTGDLQARFFRWAYIWPSSSVKLTHIQTCAFLLSKSNYWHFLASVELIFNICTHKHTHTQIHNLTHLALDCNSF